MQEFAGSLKLSLSEEQKREVEVKEMFQFVNPPALQTSNRAEGNEKALQHSSHGKRKTVKAALYVRL